MGFSPPSRTLPTKIRASGERGATAQLAHGVFFGRYRSEAAVGGFSVAQLFADPHKDVQRHTHESAHFIFVTRGTYVTSAAGAPQVSKVPILIYNPPGTTHRDRFRRGDEGGFEGSFCSISVAPERMASVVEAVPLLERASSVSSVRATALAVRLTEELREWDAGSSLVAEALCLELLACVARRDARVHRNPPAWLSIARDLLRDGGELRSVDEIASHCGVHPVHLARVFRQFFGCTPGVYLRRSRVERAATLLSRRRLTLAEIAQRAGFADQSHMSRAFRACLGITPSAYRRAGARPMFESYKELASLQDDSDSVS